MYEELVKRLLSLSEIDAIQQEPGICRITMECIGAIKEIAIEAADAIEELQRHYCRHAIHNEHDRGDDSLCDKYKCEVNAFPKWIPVEERLPEDTYPVLVTYLGYFDKLPKSDMVAMWDDGDWYWYYDESKCKVAITHWMPLPEPPKEETRPLSVSDLDG